MIVLQKVLPGLIIRPVVQSNVAWLDHNEGTRELTTMFPHQLGHGLSERSTSAARKTDEDYAGSLCLADEHKPTKIGIFGKKDALVSVCLFDQLAVNGSRGVLGNSDHIMAFSPKGADDGKVTAFIGQKPKHCRSYPD